MLEVRRELERWLVGAAARRARDEERARFLTLSKEMDRAARKDGGGSFLKCDREFIHLLVAAARNEFATEAMNLLQGCLAGSGSRITKNAQTCRRRRGCTRESRWPSPPDARRTPSSGWIASSIMLKNSQGPPSAPINLGKSDLKDVAVLWFFWDSFLSYTVS